MKSDDRFNPLQSSTHKQLYKSMPMAEKVESTLWFSLRFHLEKVIVAGGRVQIGIAKSGYWLRFPRRRL